jgi:class 3 adenylate cyclase
MEPQIRYAKASDGVNIAYATVGQGSPIVLISGSFSHVQIEWAQPALRHGYELLATQHTLIRFDHRGLGLSDREVEDFSLEARLRDIDAVLGAVGRTELVLMGMQHGGLAAVAYAARHPEAISHLILLDAFASGEERANTPQGRAMAELLKGDWDMWTENVGALALGWGREESHQFGAFVRAAVAGDAYRRIFADLVRTDVTELLPMVQTPTLVVKHTGLEYVSMEITRRLAAGIAGANLVVVEGKLTEATEQVQAAIDEFLGDASTPVSGRARASAASGTAVILFTDIVDSTRLTERMGDVSFRDASRSLDAGLRAAIRDAGGMAIDGKVLGDGVLATFQSAAQAIDGARRCLSLSAASDLGLHIGLHAGDVIREDNNVYGGAVNIASRICSLSAPGEILVSDVVRGMARTSSDVAFEDRGEHALKGVADAQRVFAVRPS